MLFPQTSLAISGGERSRGLQIFEKKKGLRSFLGRKGQIDSWPLWGETALRFLRNQFSPLLCLLICHFEDRPFYFQAFLLKPIGAITCQEQVNDCVSLQEYKSLSELRSQRHFSSLADRIHFERKKPMSDCPGQVEIQFGHVNL